MESYDLTRISVLVVEAHSFMRRLIISILRTFRISDIREAADPDTAFAMLSELPPDLIITDWAPDLDGIYLLHRIRRDPTCPDPYVPIVVITANTEVRHVCTARDAGTTEFLAKPVSARLVYLRICSVIERHRVFIRSGNFVGPDRRRRRASFEGIDRRRHANVSASDRRKQQISFKGPERRQGHPGNRPAENRTEERS